MRARRRVRPADSVEPAEVMPPGPHDGVVDGDDKAAGVAGGPFGRERGRPARSHRGRQAAETSAWRTHWRNVSGVAMPSLAAIERDRRILGRILITMLDHQAHCALPESLGSCFGMKIILPGKGVSTDPGRFTALFGLGSGRTSGAL